jgi:hypothetical protein
MVLFENESYRISLDTEIPCLEWLGFSSMTSKEFRESEWMSIDFIKEYKKKYPKLEWFVDAREVGLISTEDTSWAVEEILPRVASLGISKEAFVVSESALGKLIIKNFKSKAGETIEIKLFSSSEDAKSWLKE